jgi:phosphomannomutase
MAQTDAVFAGEHSGHFYFRDFWRADSGLLAAMHVLSALGASPPGTTMSSMLARYDRYVASGEVNRTVADVPAATAAVRGAFAGRPGVRFDDLDGLSVDGPDWWFSLRPSGTEPLLRLNAEAVDRPTMEAVRDEVLALVGGAGAAR